jgi:galactofuranose transport system permease protein
MTSITAPSSWMAALTAKRKYLPIGSTAGLFLLAYVAGVVAFDAMRSGQVFFNLFNAAPFLICTVVGETFVVITGGIDLSVSGILALGTIISASLLQQGWSPWQAFPVVLAMGVVFGLAMGLFITYLKVQPFIATLAGMWLARGLCYVISDAEIRIHDHTYTTLNQTKILIPGLADPVAHTGPYITYLVAAALVVFVLGLFILHLTRFGRTAYAIGGGAGANEVSARLMGLPVNRTKVLAYVISGFCSALAGILYSIYVNSGNGKNGDGFELTTIAAVVIGGVALTGGEGYLAGSLIGVLMTSLIQSLIQYNGTLSSYWTYIVIGALMLLFIGIQSLVVAWNANVIGRARSGGKLRKAPIVWYKRGFVRKAVIGFVVIVVGIGGFQYGLPALFPSTTTVACTSQAMRPDQAKFYSTDGAVIVLERNGGTACIEEIIAIYGDGKVIADYGTGNSRNKTVNVPAEKVSAELEKIDGYRWFTADFFDANPTRCAACYSYSLTVTYNGQTKTVLAVDGTTAVQAKYWNITGELVGLLPAGLE